MSAACNSIRTTDSIANSWRLPRKTASCGCGTNKEARFYAYATLVGHQNAPSCVAFSSDGELLATGSADRTVKLWKIMSGLEQGTLQGHSGEIRAVAFSPDGRTLASGSEDGTLKLWDVTTGQELISLDASRGGVHAVAFSPDGNVLASSGAAGDGRGEILLWSTASGPGDSTAP